jgi:dephospho-CoA kinase
MIIAIAGSLCSGKASLAEFIKANFDFNIINLFEVFLKQQVEETGIQITNAHSL